MAKTSKKAKKGSAPTTGGSAKAKGPSRSSKSSWKVFDRGSVVVSGLLAQRVARVAWRGVTGRKPPVNGQHPEVGATEAVAWAMIGGGLVELVRVGVRRGAATYWVKSTGQLPPGMKPLTAKIDTPVEKAAAVTPEPKVRGRSRGR